MKLPLAVVITFISQPVFASQALDPTVRLSLLFTAFTLYFLYDYWL